MAIGTDDKIVLAGNQTLDFAPYFLSGGHYAVTRLNADGTLDSSFAETGHKVFQSVANGAPVFRIEPADRFTRLKKVMFTRSV